MSKIPHDIITDIFRQLPVKTLLRFRCLSTPLCFLIDSREFIDLHLDHSIRNKSNYSIILKDWHLHALDFDSIDEAVEFDHPLRIGGGTEAVGTCNGLVALRNSERDLAFYNPSTRKFKRLPVSEIEPPGDSKTGYVYYGFGYDSVHDDYKLVRVACFVREDDGCEFSDYNCEVKVYSLKNHSWKRIKDLPHYLRLLNKPFYHVLHKRGYGVFSGRSLHWVLPQRLELGLRSTIIAFDIVTEKFSEVPQPDYDVEDFNCRIDVTALEGHLCVMRNCEHLNVDIWIMKDYGVKESWTKVFSVKRINAAHAFMFVRPLAYSKEGDKVLLEWNDSKLVWYDWKRKSANRVKIRGCPKTFGAEIYVESLVPLDEDVRTEQKKKQAREAEEKRYTSYGKRRDDFLSVGFKLKL